MPDGFTLEQLRSIRNKITENVAQANSLLQNTSQDNVIDIKKIIFSATYPLGISLLQLYILNITISLLELNLYRPEKNELVEVTQDDLLNNSQLNLVIDPELSMEQILEHYETHKLLSDLYLVKTFPDKPELKEKITDYLATQRENIITVFSFDSKQFNSLSYFFGTGIVLFSRCRLFRYIYV